MSKFDFMASKMQHSEWKEKMRAFLDGSVPMSEAEAVSHRDCELGKWLYSEGIYTYGAITEMQELEKIHAELHSYVRDIVTLKNSGDVSGAETRFHNLDSVSKTIMNLLDVLDKKVQAI